MARNTTIRAVAELVSKFASLALIAVLAREEGAAALGVLVFALAWCEIATSLIEMGFDAYFLRRVARDRTELDRCFFNVLTLKLVRAVPVIAVSSLLVWLLGYDEATRTAVYVLTAALLLDTLSYTIFAAFNAVERAELIGVALATQRILTAGLGVAALLAGYGVVVVTVMYAVGSATGFVMALALLARHVRLPRLQLPRAARRDLRRRSLPFATQELLSAGIARIDFLLLSALATPTVVGHYGAAYRLLEATLFISAALQGAFAAMYTYLDDRSDPTIRTVFQRSIKLSLALLVPSGITLVVLASPLLKLLFGESFTQAEAALRLLGPTVVVLGIVLLSTTLISSRLDPRSLALYFGLALVVNVALNLLLIPPLGAAGAALGMLVTELVIAVLALRTSLRAVGALRVTATIGSPFVAGFAMAITMFVLQGILAVALAAGVVVYVAVYTVVERRLAPADFDFLAGVLRSRLPSKIVP